MEVTDKSIYESIFPEDSRQYRQLAKRYMDLKPENYRGAYEISQEAWGLAQRWSDIQSNISILSVEKGVKKTDLKDWAYQRYRQLQFVHEFARMVWASGEREAKEIKLLEMRR